MAIPERFVDELNSRLNIVDVVSSYVALNKKGGNHWGLCPFHHEKTPSFSVSPDKQIYHCFGCKKGGGVVNFIMEIENLSYPDAIRHLAQRAGMTVPEDDRDGMDKLRARLIALNRDAARYYYQVLQSEEGKALISEASAKYLEVKATEEAGEAERMANYEKSVQDIAAFAQEKGLTDEQAVAVFEKINQIGFDVIEGKYTREAMQMAYDAMNFSTAVESARKEGERDGRNAKIEEKLAKVNKPVDMPPAVGGQGATVPEPKAKVRDSFFDAQRDEVNRGYGRKSAFEK